MIEIGEAISRNLVALPNPPKEAIECKKALELRLELAKGHYKSGGVCLAKGDWLSALVHYQKALVELPFIPTTKSQRETYVVKFTEVAADFAEREIQAGNVESALKLLAYILRPEIAPQSKSALKLLTKLEQQKTRYASQLRVAVDTWHKYMETHGNADLAAHQYYEAVFCFTDIWLGENIDGSQPPPFFLYSSSEKLSSKLPGGKQLAERALFAYFDAVNSSQNRLFGKQILYPPIEDNPPIVNSVGNAIEAKLKSIVIPELHFDEMALREALDILRQKSIEYDTEKHDQSKKKGIDIVAALPAFFTSPKGEDEGGFGFGQQMGSDDGSVMSTPISLRLTEVPIGVALRYTCDLAQLRYIIRQGAVVIIPHHGLARESFIHSYKLPWALMARLLQGDESVQACFESYGVKFLDDEFAMYNRNRSILVVKNDYEQLALIEVILNSLAVNALDPVSAPEVGEIAKSLVTTEQQINSIETIRQKLDTIRIPEIIYTQLPLEDVLIDLQRVAKQNDKDGVGISFLFDSAENSVRLEIRKQPDNKSLGNQKINLRLRDVTLRQVLYFIAYICGDVDERITPEGIEFIRYNDAVPSGDNSLYTYQYQLKPRFFSNLDPVTAFIEAGLPKEGPPGSAILWNAKNNQLTITDTVVRLTMFEAILESMDGGRRLK